MLISAIMANALNLSLGVNPIEQMQISSCMGLVTETIYIEKSKGLEKVIFTNHKYTNS